MSQHRYQRSLIAAHDLDLLALSACGGCIYRCPRYVLASAKKVRDDDAVDQFILPSWSRSPKPHFATGMNQ